MNHTRTISGSDLGPQAFLGVNEPSEDRFNPVVRDKRSSETPYFLQKPRGDLGLWTSSLLTDGPGISGWADWCALEGYGLPEQHLWILHASPDVQLAEVDSFEDLERLHHRFGHTNHRESWLDFGAISEHYAGVHLTDEGQWQTRLTRPYHLYGWDCESTVWLRWPFIKVEDWGMVTIREEEHV